MSSAAAPLPPTVETVEEVVRGQLSKALGGRRGMIEAAVPTLLFTVLYLSTRDRLDNGLHLAIGAGAVAALVLLAVRLVQRSSVQYCVNAFVGVGIGAAFAMYAGSRGGSADDQALAYFLPGLIYNSIYSVLLGLSALTRWPVVGFMIGSVTGDPTGWRANRQVVDLCTKLTWLFVLPCVLRVVAQLPLWLAARGGAMSKDTAILWLGILKVAMGWPLTLVCAAAMVWLLNRDVTPVEDAAAVEQAFRPSED